MFEGIKIVEFASVLAGPLVGTFFSELGAEVIKIENKTTGGDVTRNWKLPSESKEGVSAYFAAANYNKKSLFLNLKESEDYALAMKLVKDADIVITNFKFGDAKKLKLDYSSLSKLNEQLIYAEITGYGKKVNRPAFDVVLQAETGFMYMNGTPESGPVKMPVALIDVLAAHQLKQGILCALIKKLKKNEGSYITVSLYDAALSSLANQATNWLMAKHIPKPIGSQHPNIAPYGDMFYTKDHKLLVLAVGTEKQFVALCTEIGISDLSCDINFKTNALRVKNRKSLNNILTNVLKTKNAHFWITTFRKNNIPVGEIKNLQEVFSDELSHEMILEENTEKGKMRKVKTVAFKIL